MLKSVVEKHAFAFLPVRNGFAHPNAALALGFWDDQTEMVANHSLVWATVRRDVHAGRKDRKEGRFRARDFLEQLDGARAAGAIPGRLQTVGEEEKRLPLVLLRKVRLVGRDILKV